MPQKLNSVKDKLFETIFMYAHGGIAIVSLEGKWLKVNQSVVDFLGYPEAELYNTSFQDITHKDDLDKDLFNYNQLLRGEIEKYSIEKRYFHKSGKIIWALISVSLVRDLNQNPMYFIAQIMDITKQKVTSWKMEALMKIVKDQNQKLSDFAQIAAHDIRSHVGNLNTITEFMEDENDALVDTENFLMLKEALQNLNATVAHLSEARIDNLMAKDDLKMLNLYEFSNMAIYNVMAIAKNKNCTIINNVDPSLEVLALKVYLDSIILNFLTNAIKYRSEKRDCLIELSSKDQENWVVLEVKDNGLGMDLSVAEDRIFKLNGTFHSHADSKGVGLFITKNHIESIGGRVEVESEPDVGTTFRIFFKKA